MDKYKDAYHITSEDDHPFLNDSVGIHPLYEGTSIINTDAVGPLLKAEHTINKERVAIKLLPPGVAVDRRDLHQFTHRHTITVKEVLSSQNGDAIIVMNPPQGTSLHAILASQKRLKIHHAVNIALRILETVNSIHASGRVHKNINSKSVFLLRDAKQGIEANLLYLALRAKGIPLNDAAYLSPEQAVELGKDTPKDDLWAIGVLLYEMIYGELPFKGKTADETIGRILLQDVFIPPNRLRSYPILYEFIRRALTKKKSERYEDAATMATDLTLGLKKVTVPAPTGSSFPPADGFVPPTSSYPPFSYNLNSIIPDIHSLPTEPPEPFDADAEEDDDSTPQKPIILEQNEEQSFIMEGENFNISAVKSDPPPTADTPTVPPLPGAELLAEREKKQRDEQTVPRVRSHAPPEEACDADETDPEVSSPDMTNPSIACSVIAEEEKHHAQKQQAQVTKRMEQGDLVYQALISQRSHSDATQVKRKARPSAMGILLAVTLIIGFVAAGHLLWPAFIKGNVEKNPLPSPSPKISAPAQQPVDKVPNNIAAYKAAPESPANAVTPEDTPKPPTADGMAPPSHETQPKKMEPAVANESVTISLVGLPKGTKVTLNARYVKLPVVVPRSEKPLKMRVFSPWHRALTVSVVPDQDKSLDVGPKLKIQKKRKWKKRAKSKISPNPYGK